MVGEIAAHVVEGESVEVAATDHARGERTGGVEQQAGEEAALAGQDDRHQGLGVESELGEGVQLREHLEAQQVGFVDDQQRDLFLALDVEQEVADGGAEDGQSGARRAADLRQI